MFCQSSPQTPGVSKKSPSVFFLPCYLYRIVIRIRLAANKRGKRILKKKRLATQRGQYYLSIPRAFLLHNFMTSTRLGSAGQGRTGDCVHHSLSFPSDVGRRRLP